jgi:hypothetical protein
MHASSLQTGTKIDRYNATQAIYTDLLQRVVWKCVKIEPFFNLNVHTKGYVGGETFPRCFS